MRFILTCFLIASVLVASDACGQQVNDATDPMATTTTTTPPPIKSGSRGECTNVKMVTRKQWETQSSSVYSVLMHVPVSRLLIHHTDAGTCSGRIECDELVRNHHNHLIVNDQIGYNNLIYNFLITPDGFVYEGAGWRKQGYATKQYNILTVGFTFIGKFETAPPTAAALQAAKDLIDCGIDTHKLATNFRLQGDEDVKDIKGPGRQLKNELKTWPEYSPPK